MLSIVLPLVATLAACAGPRRTVHTANYPDGQPRWRSEMHGGVPDGESVTWHANGQVASRGVYRDGAKQGPFSYYDEHGALVRVEEFRDGAMVAATEGADAREPITPPGVAASAMDTAGDDTHDRYTELRLGLGFGATNSARNRASKDSAEAVASMNMTLLRRNGSRILGVSTRFSEVLFGTSHSHVGGLVGYAGSGRGVHLELLAEGGVHTISQIGDDLFATSMGDTSAMLPYLGVHGRLLLDLGDPNGVVVELAVAQRVDLVRTTREVVQETCFFGCSSERQVWDIGGSTGEVVAGFSYQF